MLLVRDRFDDEVRAAAGGGGVCFVLLLAFLCVLCVGCWLCAVVCVALFASLLAGGVNTWKFLRAISFKMAGKFRGIFSRSSYIRFSGPSILTRHNSIATAHRPPPQKISSTMAAWKESASSVVVDRWHSSINQSMRSQSSCNPLIQLQ